MSPIRRIRPHLATVYRSSRDAGVGWMPAGALPGALIIGAQKAGTTSLWQALARHPDVRPSRMKEVHYADRNWHRGTDWYRRAFQRGDGMGVEATPNYLFHPRAAQRMATTAPEAKIIAILREPVARAVSHHAYETARGNETRPFLEAVEAEAALDAEWEQAVRTGHWSDRLERQSYLRRGLYAEHLFRWQTHFPEDRFMVLEDRDLYEDPETVLRQICRFLGLAEYPLALPRLNMTPVEPVPGADALCARFEADGMALKAAFGNRFSWLR